MNTSVNCRTAYLLALLCWVVFKAGASSATPEEPKKAGAQAPTDAPTAAASPAMSDDPACRRCHACDRPTPEEPCLLHPCIRERAQRHKVDMGMRRGPGVVLLDDLEDCYLPVPFDHENHARMAEMTRGCIVCHHCPSEGREHAACKTCHAVEVTEMNTRAPDLRTAYHHRCLNCHKDWIDVSDCSICHQRRASVPGMHDAMRPSTDDILARMHPPISEPQTEFYRAVSEEGTETTVIFRHWEHVHRFGLGCEECHQEGNCTHCHVDDAGREPRTVREHHRPCVRCHGADMADSTTAITDKCRRCHYQEGQRTPRPFDHADTGWPLGRYHKGRSCRGCHKNVPFVRQSTDCNSCHREWEPDTFDHAALGQVLDDNHKEIDCADCHTDRQFDAPPECDKCHDEEEGIVFPFKRPGPAWRRKATSSG
jgi:hypothetical protein